MEIEGGMGGGRGGWWWWGWRHRQDVAASVLPLLLNP